MPRTLVVPVRDRRQHKRILTLKNFRRFLILVVVFLVGLTIDISRRSAPGEYGRLMQKEIARNDDVRPRPAVVTEAPVSDQTSADPMLVAPAAREQEFLSTTTTSAPAPAPTPITTGGSGVTIVGDTSGVTIVRGGDPSAKHPVLAGGIFKNP
jgi:hypothetical protein